MKPNRCPRKRSRQELGPPKQTSLPGLKMPFGSNSFLMFFITVERRFVDGVVEIGGFDIADAMLA